MLEFTPTVFSCSTEPYPKTTGDGIASKGKVLESLYSRWTTVLIILNEFVYRTSKQFREDWNKGIPYGNSI